jgi:hypothetical protein
MFSRSCRGRSQLVPALALPHATIRGGAAEAFDEATGGPSLHHLPRVDALRLRGVRACLSHTHDYEHRAQTRPYRHYCSNACRQRAYRKRRKQLTLVARVCLDLRAPTGALS